MYINLLIFKSFGEIVKMAVLDLEKWLMCLRNVNANQLL